MKRIEEGTRFGAADVEVADFKAAAAPLGLWGTYTVRVKRSENETDGHANLSRRDMRAATGKSLMKSSGKSSASIKRPPAGTQSCARHSADPEAKDIPTAPTSAQRPWSSSLQ